MRVTSAVERVGPDGRFFSCEFFPPKTPAGVENLVARARRLVDLGALFLSVTWGAGGSHSDTSLGLALRFKHELHVPTVLHLTCTNMDRAILDRTLEIADREGIDNILALRGDAPRNDYAQKSVLTCAADLVSYIRERYGDRFCIGVAGYPEGHAAGAAAVQSVDADLPHLEAKVDAGADFIITQLFYDPAKFVNYERKLRSLPSQKFKTIPIIPGLMPINTYPSLLRSAKLSHASIPVHVLEKMIKVDIKDDVQIKRLGIDIICDVVESLLKSGVRGVHFYTLNLERSLSSIIERTGLSSRGDSRAGTPSAADGAAWDDFPNGRYTDPRSAAFGEIDGYGPVVHGADSGDAVTEWGEPASNEDISQLFVKHITNEIEVIPFSDEPLSAETALIQEQLIAMNQAHMWTLASQPAAHSVDSLDRIFGWGPPDGRIYQMAFVEFFVDRADWPELRTALKLDDQVRYFAGAEKGPVETNCQPKEELVVTWGEWGCANEVANSTIIMEDSFKAWRDEAFEILRGWQVIYPENSKSYKHLGAVAKDRMLVTAVHLDSTKEQALWKLLMKPLRAVNGG